MTCWRYIKYICCMGGIDAVDSQNALPTAGVSETRAHRFKVKEGVLKGI